MVSFLLPSLSSFSPIYSCFFPSETAHFLDVRVCQMITKKFQKQFQATDGKGTFILTPLRIKRKVTHKNPQRCDYQATPPTHTGRL